MIRTVTGDIFTSRASIIAHQVNCRGAMGSGVARQVREKFPEVYEAYKEACGRMHVGSGTYTSLLGTNLYVTTRLYDRHITIANMFAQQDYGYDGKQYTNYKALCACLKDLRRYVLFESTQNRNASIAIPYRLGCCRGGGDWQVVYDMICKELADCDVTLYKLPEGREP